MNAVVGRSLDDQIREEGNNINGKPTLSFVFNEFMELYRSECSIDNINKCYELVGLLPDYKGSSFGLTQYFIHPIRHFTVDVSHRSMFETAVSLYDDRNKPNVRALYNYKVKDARFKEDAILIHDHLVAEKIRLPKIDQNFRLFIDILNPDSEISYLGRVYNLDMSDHLNLARSKGTDKFFLS